MGCGPARIALVAGHGYVRITQYTLVQLPRCRSAPTAHPSFCFSLTTHPHPHHLGLYGRYARSRPRRLYESEACTSVLTSSWVLALPS